MMILAIFTGVLYSCEDWLEVNADSRMVEEDLFSEGTGYRTAVNGVYRLLGDPTLYAKDLSWGLVSVLGQNYDANKLPTKYQPIAQWEYEDADALGIIDPVWEEGYNVIANCNNIIAHTVNKDASFFDEGQREKDFILGEMVGVRAMMHFDLLRLFAPAPVVDNGASYLPYVTVYPTIQPKHLPVAIVLDSIIKDLEYSKKLLVGYDTLNRYAIGTVYGVESNSASTVVEGGIFFQARNTRMNYFGATAILARVYLWKGDQANAFRCANELYQFLSRKKWFQFTPSSGFETGSEDWIYRKMYHDAFLVAVNYDLYNVYKNAKEYNYYFFYYKNVTELFDPDKDDYRRTKLINADGSSRRWAQPEGDLTNYTTMSVIRYEKHIAPMVRLSEMYYILCECLAETDLPRAVELLRTLRLARGAKTPLPDDLQTSKSGFLDVLYNDMTREFMSEGQTFYLYKRLNKPMFNGSSPIDMTGHYNLPIPYSEEAYSNL